MADSVIDERKQPPFDEKEQAIVRIYEENGYQIIRRLHDRGYCIIPPRVVSDIWGFTDTLRELADAFALWVEYEGKKGYDRKTPLTATGIDFDREMAAFGTGQREEPQESREEPQESRKEKKPKTKAEKLQAKIARLESTLSKEIERETQVVSNRGFGYGMRHSKIGVSTRKSDELREKIKALRAELGKLAKDEPDEPVLSQWLDDMTFMTEFVMVKSEDGFEQIVTEWHEDEDRWVVERYFYDDDEEFTEHELIEDEAVRQKYIAMAEVELKKNTDN